MLWGKTPNLLYSHTFRLDIRSGFGYAKYLHKLVLHHRPVKANTFGLKFAAEGPWGVDPAAPVALASAQILPIGLWVLFRVPGGTSVVGSRKGGVEHQF